MSTLAPRFTMTLALALTLACGGCSAVRSPFLPNEGDYARRVALERLRSIAPADFAAHRPQNPTDLNNPDAVIDSVRQERARFEAMEQMDLTIEQARADALAHNLNLRVALIDPAIARETLTEEDNRFNSVFDLRATYTDSRQVTGSRVSTQDSKNLSLEPQLRIPNRSGGTLTISPNLAYNEQNNEFADIPAFYSTGLTFSLSQPLLRSAGRRVNTAGIRIAGYELQGSEARTKLEVIRQLSEAERAYWSLSAARSTLDVRVQQLELAQAQLEKARRRVQEGLSPDVEIDRARAGVAQRLEGLVLAQNDVLSRQRSLKSVINRPGLDVDTPTRIVPTSMPDPVEYDFDRAALQQAALANRMELLDLEMQLAADAARVLLARDATLPDVRFLANYGVGGVDEFLGESFDKAADSENRQFSVGVSVSRPWDNEAARAALRRSLLSRIQRTATKELRERTIREEVAGAVDRLTTGWQRILATRQAAIAAGTALQSEQRQFDLGRSTSTDVLDAASRLAEAQQAEIGALVEYQIAQVDLAQATGTLLGAAKVQVESMPAPDITRPDPVEGSLGDQAP